MKPYQVLQDVLPPRTRCCWCDRACDQEEADFDNGEWMCRACLDMHLAEEHEQHMREVAHEMRSER